MSVKCSDGYQQRRRDMVHSRSPGGERAAGQYRLWETLSQQCSSNGRRSYSSARKSWLGHQKPCQRCTITGCLLCYFQALTLRPCCHRVEYLLARSHCVQEPLFFVGQSEAVAIASQGRWCRFVVARNGSTFSRSAVGHC